MIEEAQSGFARAIDALIPGEGEWPPASLCISAPADLAGLSAEDRGWLDAQLDRSPTDWRKAWTRAESTEPQRFARLLYALYDAYYGAPVVTRHLAAMAEAGPREPDDTFDPTLIQLLRKDRP